MTGAMRAAVFHGGRRISIAEQALPPAAAGEVMLRVARAALCGSDTKLWHKGAVHTLDRSNGQSVWKQDKLSYRQVTQPLPEGHAIAVGDFEGFVHFLARDSGAFVSRFDTRGGAVRAVPIALPAGLLVQSEDGSLHALVP